MSDTIKKYKQRSIVGTYPVLIVDQNTEKKKLECKLGLPSKWVNADRSLTVWYIMMNKERIEVF